MTATSVPEKKDSFCRTLVPVRKYFSLQKYSYQVLFSPFGNTSGVML